MQVETAEGHLAAAEQAIRQGHAQDALREARLALQQQPENGRGFALVGLAYTLMGEERDARTALDRAVELAPRDAKIRGNYYTALARLGDAPAARTQLTYFVELEPANAPAQAALTKLGGPMRGIPPLPAAAREAVWYDGGGHALSDAGDLEDENAEPPPGPNVIVCPECEKRTWKGWTCRYCGVPLPRV